MPYRRSIPARKRPTRENTVTARKILLDGLAGDASIFDLISEQELIAAGPLIAKPGFGLVDEREAPGRPLRGRQVRFWASSAHHRGTRLLCPCGGIVAQVQDLPGRDARVVEKRPKLPGHITRVAQLPFLMQPDELAAVGKLVVLGGP